MSVRSVVRRVSAWWKELAIHACRCLPVATVSAAIVPMTRMGHLFWGTLWLLVPAVPVAAVTGIVQGRAGAMGVAMAAVVCWTGVVLGCVGGGRMPRRWGAWGRYVVGMLIRTPVCLAGALAAGTGHMPGVSRVSLFWIVVFYLWSLAVEVAALMRELKSSLPSGEREST